MDFNSSLRIAATGLHAQTARMRVIAENLANADSAGKAPGEEPYRRRIPTFQTTFDAEVGGKIVEVGNLAYDMSDFSSRYEPGHPAADVCRSFVIMMRAVAELAETYLDRYAALSGTPKGEIIAWLPVIAAARLAENIPEEEEALIRLAGGV